MIGALILAKIALKLTAVSAKTAVTRKAAVSGVILASGATEVIRNNKYKDFKKPPVNNSDDLEIL